ncbi:hypothetical protein GCM10010339_90750 [Streptomyces alanosinicus]|uniref:Uncharacterized protein n=1 Tax=Streptomyces alanosinicus TaxID=68171 RepID=A0A919D8M2_9ACTN|nr:hypothetical protein GCM10010339_90750 [Streptomyces alanosinicus]
MAATYMIAPHIHGDCHKPGTQPQVPAPLRGIPKQCRVRAQERFLAEVIGVRAGSADAVEERVNSSSVNSDKLRKSRVEIPGDEIGEMFRLLFHQQGNTGVPHRVAHRTVKVFRLS